jgi:hypothetical protein
MHARLPGEACWARLPGKAAGQGCRARLPGKAAGQVCRERLHAIVQYAESVPAALTALWERIFSNCAIAGLLQIP